MSTRRKVAILVGVLIITALAIIGLLVAPPSHADPFPPAPLALASDPDQRGVRTSTYTGIYFRPADEGWRRCIVQREASGRYFAINPTGKYRGAYQMDRELARGAAWEMTPELKTMFPTRWRLIRNTLRDNTIDLWSRFYQDMAFATLVHVDGDYEGAPHWSGGRWHCYPGMPWSGA